MDELEENLIEQRALMMDARINLEAAAINFAQHEQQEGAPRERAFAALLTSARQVVAFELILTCAETDATTRANVKNPPLKPVK